MPNTKPNKQPQNALAIARSKIAEIEKELEAISKERDQLKEYAQALQIDLTELTGKYKDLENRFDSLMLGQNSKKDLFT